MLKSNWSSLTIVQIARSVIERRCRRRLRFFSCGGTLGPVRSRKKASPKLPWTSLSPQMDINPSSSADRTSKVSPTTIHANPSLLLLPLTLPHPRCPTVQSDSSPWTLITVSSARFHRLRVHLPWSYQHLVSVFCSTSVGRTLTGTSTCSSTYSLVQALPSVCSLNTQGSFSRL